jgi:hypothetical protein
LEGLDWVINEKKKVSFFFLRVFYSFVHSTVIVVQVSELSIVIIGVIMCAV